MNTDDTIVLLAADPATAYREYLYRPSGQFADGSMTGSRSWPGQVGR
jgi:hypothetical protein